MVVRFFEDLDARKAAHQMPLAVCRITRMFPKEELFGLTSQMRRAAVSVEGNLAENFGRRSPRELLRYARISNGSLQEVRCYLKPAGDLGYCVAEDLFELRKLTDRTGALIGGPQSHLKVASAGVRD